MSIFGSGGPYVPSSFLPFSWFSIPYVDTNGDGKTDILWGNINPLDPNLLPLDGLAIWTINGSTIESGAFLPISPEPNTLANWLPVSFKSLDFNGDGKSDIAWQNLDDGRKVIWLLDGINIQEASFIQSAPNSSPGWVAYLAYEIVDYDLGTLINTTDDLGVVRDLDFNGDGKTDIFWENELTGEKAIWIMDGTSIMNGALLPFSPDGTTGWSFNFADFTGNGKTDIFWSKPGENNAIWIMDGPNIVNGGFLQGSPDGTSGWDFAFVDFSGDGKEDIFWSKPGENNAIWIMDGPNIASGGFLQGSPDGTSGWDFAFVDFNGDGKEDIFWSKPGENNAIWIMNGSNIANGSFLQSSPDGTNSSNWDFAFGDFNSDGKADIFWSEKGGGQTAIWIMDGGVINAGAFLQGQPNTTSAEAWQFYLTDFTGNGKSDIYWKNGISNETAIWVMDGPQIVDGALLQNDPGAYPFPLPTV